MVATPVVPLDPPIELVGRTFTRGCDLDIASLAAYLNGVELAEFVPRLGTFPDKANWSIRLRRPLVRLTELDARLIRRELTPIVHEPPNSALQEYLERIKPVGSYAC